MNLKSKYGHQYQVKKMSVLGFELITLRDLDESIDTLCAYFGEGNEDLSLKEEHCPYFGVLWEASIALGQFLSPEICGQKKVLEIGCGLALPSFVATKFNGRATATDFHEDVPLFLAENFKQNNIKFSYQMMNWRLKDKNICSSLGGFDLVLGSDILYESQHPEEVAHALVNFLNPNGKIILTDPGRAYVQNFISAMNKLGYQENLTIEKVEASLTLKNKDREIYVFEFFK